MIMLAYLDAVGLWTLFTSSGPIVLVETIFVTCSWLHNFLLDLMERDQVPIGRGLPIGDDGMWLSSNTNVNSEEAGSDRILSAEFIHRRNVLVKHLHVFRQKGDIQE